MPTYKDGISPNIREMVTKINKCGVAKLKRYSERFHPRFDFDKAMTIIRHVAKYGYKDAGYRFNVSRQLAEQKLKKCYEMAKEAERWQETL